MTTQLDIQGDVNLTQVRVKTFNHELQFVTARPYRAALLRILSITRMMTEGEITEDEAVLRIAQDTPHFPVFGNEQEVQDYVDCLGGHHINADYTANEIFIGRNNCRATWGRVAIGGFSGDIIWDDDGGPDTLEARDD